MRFGSGLLLLGCALGGIVGARAESASAGMLGELRGIYVRIDRASREVEANRADGATDSAALDARIAGLRSALDSVRKRLAAGESAEVDDVGRKVDALLPLLGNLERAAKAERPARPIALVPAHLPAARRARLAPIDTQHGASCGNALGLGVDGELDGTLPAHTDLWLRVAAPATGGVAVSTAATPLDTEIAVFDACPNGAGGVPQRISDDAFGLAATVLLRARPNASYWLRVRNLGDTGEAAIISGASGAISGHVRESSGGAAIPYAQLYAFDDALDYAGQINAQADGAYELALPPGSYFVTATASAHVGEAWPNAECTSAPDIRSCPLLQAQPVVVASDATTDSIDFSLGTGAVINGRVRDDAGAAIAQAQITVSDAQGQGLLYTWSDSVGRYRIAPLPAGTYYVEATAQAYRAQVFDEVDCADDSPFNCDPRIGTPLPIASGQTVNDIDFQLQRMPYANVTVYAVSGSSQTSAQIWVFDSVGNTVMLTSVPLDQPSAIGPLLPGTYYVAAQMYDYMAQLYDHFDCSGDCAYEFGSGTPVVITAASAPPELRFDLRPLASVSGRITEAGSGIGLADVAVGLWSSDGSFSVVNAYTESDGSYRATAVSPGSYWVVARSGDHADTLYPDAPCDDRQYGSLDGCQLTEGQVVVVGEADVSAIDIAMPRNGSISGGVNYRGVGSTAYPVVGTTVSVYDALGSLAGNGYTDENGHYTAIDLPAGTYYAEAVNPYAYGQIHSGIDCPVVGQSCDATVGTPIALARGQALAGIDFALVGYGRIVGRVVDADSGQGVLGVVIDVWDAVDEAHCASTTTDAGGYYAVGDAFYCASGSRKLSTDAGPVYADQVYDGIACPNGPAYLGLCSLAGATPVVLPTAAPVLPIADFALTRAEIIFRSGFE